MNKRLVSTEVIGKRVVLAARDALWQALFF